MEGKARKPDGNEQAWEVPALAKQADGYALGSTAVHPVRIKGLFSTLSSSNKQFFKKVNHSFSPKRDFRRTGLQPALLAGDAARVRFHHSPPKAAEARP